MLQKFGVILVIIGSVLFAIYWMDKLLSLDISLIMKLAIFFGGVGIVVLLVSYLLSVLRSNDKYEEFEK